MSAGPSSPRRAGRGTSASPHGARPTPISPGSGRRWSLAPPDDLVSMLPAFEVGAKVATRNAGGKVLQELAKAVPYLVGGSADLHPSTKTYIEGAGAVAKGDYQGRNIHFGVREHAMGAMLNGMQLHGGLRVLGSTFLVFADYMRPTIRLAALMKQPVIFVFTHDSIYVGEDGPTHQPVEQAESLRVIPGVEVYRPADAVEAGLAWVEALKRTDGPTVLLFTRQNVPVLAREKAPDIGGAARTCSSGRRAGNPTPSWWRAAARSPWRSKRRACSRPKGSGSGSSPSPTASSSSVRTKPTRRRSYRRGRRAW